MPGTDDPSLLCPACGTKQNVSPGSAGQEEYARTCISCGFFMKLRLQQGASDGVTFTVNGTQITVGDEFNPATSLNEYLRRTGVSRGTKQLCIEGGCGVCLVAVKLYDPVSATSQVYAVNSCLVQLYMCDGWEITTIEGLGNVRTGLHAIQKRLTKYNGAQCGFCSPAQVMNMYGLLQRNPTPTMQQVRTPTISTWCYSTGYRPILDAMKSFASDAPPSLQGGMIDIEDLNPKMCKKTGERCEGKCNNKKDKKSCSSARQRNSGSLSNVGARAGWFKPTTLQELYTLLHQHRADNHRLVSTIYIHWLCSVFKEIGPWMYNILIDVKGIRELYRIEFTPSLVWGANLTLTNIHDLCDKARSNASLPYAAVFAEHIKKVANNGVRNADHGHVIAGFNMKIDKTNNCTVLQRPTIVFQGINGTLVNSLSMLNMELTPASDPLLASADYRRSTAVSFFYKYVLDVCGDKVAQRYRSGRTSLVRPVSSAKHSYDTRQEEWPLNQPITSIDADYLVSGMSRYLDDVPLEPGELHAAFVLSTQGNAEIASMDAQLALSLPGVLRFIQASDIPPGGKNSFSTFTSASEEILCSGRVEYAGQPIGIIVADDPQMASTAASMVRVTYRNVQPPLLDLRTAINQKSFFPNQEDPVIRGDPDSAIKQSPRRLTGSVEIGDQYHFYLESQSSRCAPNDTGGMDVRATTQWVDIIVRVVADILNIPVSSVNLEVERLGGAFGGKVTRNPIVSGACALAAYIMQRPVRLVMDLHTNMKALGKRHSVIAEYEVGFTEEGKLNGIKVTYYDDCGYSDADAFLSYVTTFVDSSYFCPNWNFTSVAVKTNKATNTACRSPQGVPAQFMIETIMEHIAKTLNKDPTEIRKNNFYQEGQFSLNGSKLENCNIGLVVSQLETSSDFEARKRQVAEFNQANRWRKRGISLVPTRYGIGWGAHYSVFVAIYNSDGSVAIEHGGIDMGQGISTKVAQVCAYELGVPLSLIRVKKNSSTANANSTFTAGSMGSDLCSLGVIQCCQQLKANMAPVRMRMPTAPWKDIVSECYRSGIDLSAHAFTNPFSQYHSRYSVYTAAVAEAEVDVLTGQSQLNRVDILYDCGESLSPEIDLGQMEGGFMLGLGCHLLEESKYHPTTGALLTDGTWEYKPPLPKDLPVDFRVSFLRNAPNPLGVLRSKATGEPTVPLSSVAVFAIKHAVEAARAEIGQDTYFTLNSPALVQHVQTACQVKPEQLTFGN
ncbi:hypothetical protein C0Q70_04856 [Pomacea canaliculata]|uniref:Aldehyde oxidase/xanthine dehydrogenase a/b hammerhead domain-containing protein n=1 Tax=Pomacea canaliculata TaxID=400727 RepID=A0A2T7PJI8_POMCA|nr:hypothetical protein C0Q70_04856 [Pomacea canaliculata]